MSHLFNGTDYISHQSQALLEYFQRWGELLEINGEFLHDDFLTQVLSGYEKHSQAKILKQLFKHYPHITVTYCISAKDLVRDKQFSQKYLPFEKYILKELTLIASFLGKKAHIVITLMDSDFIPPHIRELEQLLQTQWYTTETYPLETPYTLSEPTLVCSYSSQTGKSVLCQSLQKDYKSWSTLPINVSEHHPLNILAQAYLYKPQTNNISLIENYITDLWAHQYRYSCRELIEDRITLYNKLLLTGYMEEEDIELLKNLLIYLD